MQDYDRARKVYQLALELVPHKQFTFAKLWLQYALFEVRRKNLAAARKALGRAIGTKRCGRVAESLAVVLIVHM